MSPVKCGFCEKSPASYVCPRCKAAYCSLGCYKCEKHGECSEQFYKKCVEEELRSRTGDCDEKRKMQEVLMREREAALEQDDLETRLQDVDLNDPQQVMMALTEEQRRTFKRLVESNEIAKFISIWKPWWEVPKKLIKEVNPSSGRQEDDDSLKGFVRLRKEPRAKIGGKKVKNLTQKPNPLLGQKLNGGETDEQSANLTAFDHTSVVQAEHSENQQNSTPPANPPATSASSETVKTERPENASKKVSDAATNHGQRPEALIITNNSNKTRVIDPRYRRRGPLDAGRPDGESGIKSVNDIGLSSEAGSVTKTDSTEPPVLSKSINKPSNDTSADENMVKGLSEKEKNNNRTSCCAVGVTASRSDPKQVTFLDDLIGEEAKDSKWTVTEQTLAANLVNVLAAFAFTARFLNGEMKDDPTEAVDLLESICAVFQGKNFPGADIALAEVLLKDVVVANGRREAIAQDVSKLLSCADHSRRALLEIRKLLKMARRHLQSELKNDTSSDTTTAPTTSGAHHQQATSITHLKRMMLKVDFYADWALAHCSDLLQRTVPVVRVEMKTLRADAETLKAAQEERQQLGNALNAKGVKLSANDVSRQPSIVVLD